MNIKKGKKLQLLINKYAFEGKGLTKINKSVLNVNSPQNETGMNNYVVFVDGAYPGDEVIAELTKIKKSYALAKLVEILKPSELRVKPKCKYFAYCGGCKQQDLQYSAQTEYKQKQVEEIFSKLGGLKDFQTEKIVPSEKIFFYRNKMEFSFSEKRWLTADEIKSDEKIDSDFGLGLHVPKVFDKVIDIDECFLQSELSNKILNFTRDFFKKKSATIYSTKTHTGYLRNLVIKQSFHLNQLMVNLVTSTENEELVKEYTTELLMKIPSVTTVVNNINLKKASVATGDYEVVFSGNGFIFDSIGKYKFRISANSFFQTNTIQAEKLYQTALDFAGMKGNETVFDLYSGAGTIAIFVSEYCKNVFAFESVESAVKDAKENAKLNGVENVFFFNADLYQSFLPLIEENNIPSPDIVIVDPPRSGMHKTTVNDVIFLNPGKIVYVSCNPTTQVRDIKMFCESGYSLVKIKAVDMFPQTYHIENVALLVKR